MEVDDQSELSEACYIESCPKEILLMIFKYLHIKDLFTCRSVNKTWRITADYCGQRYHKWEALLLEKNIHNMAVTFQQRSVLKYQDIYINYHMWHSVHAAQVTLKHTYDLDDVHNIHVYENNLIMVCKESVKYYNLEQGTIVKVIPETCWDYQETKFLLAKFSLWEGKKHISLYSKPHKITHKCVGCHVYNVQHNKCYLMNIKNFIVFYESTPEKFTEKILQRYYSGSHKIYSIYIYMDEMYVFVKTGDVFRYKQGEIGFGKVCKLDVPTPPGILDLNPAEIFIATFHKCSVVYRVQSKEKEKIIRNIDTLGNEHLVLLYADLTCATEHGNILLLGFNDGKVGVVIIEQLRTSNDLTPAFQFYIQNFAQVQDVRPIKKLEVYEAEGCHHVLVETNNRLYQVVISHADYYKVMP